MTSFYDTLENRAPADREADLLKALPVQVAHARSQSAAFAEILADVNPADITSRAALARLPVTRKHELHERQQAQRSQNAFGGFSTLGFGAQMPRVFASPGPIYEPEGLRRDYWRMARALYAAGFRSGELIHNCFSYHFVPAGSMMESGAHALGCTVFPGGTGQTEQQVQAMAELRPAGYIGTPSFLKLIVEKAKEMQVPLPTVTKALLSAEAFPPSLRDWFAEQGISGYQCYGTADLGLIAYETAAREGLVLDEHVIVEIVRPGTGDPVPEGEVGELVVTTLNPDYPLIRFGTGDLSAILPGPCPTGRTNTRIKGWMGRADQTTKVRGMFVHPGQVAAIASRFPQVLRARLVVSGEMANDQMVLQVETTETSGGLAT
ncbi:MAG: AMP-binding protein, partial [Giesbergeria sp.]|nr:AMP-binding protein [Giesbergeria sp.]